jgi:hypothetical protein
MHFIKLLVGMKINIRNLVILNSDTNTNSLAHQFTKNCNDYQFQEHNNHIKGNPKFEIAQN